MHWGLSADEAKLIQLRCCDHEKDQIDSSDKKGYSSSAPQKLQTAFAERQERRGGTGRRRKVEKGRSARNNVCLQLDTSAHEAPLVPCALHTCRSMHVHT
ncbi:hypothetical protein JRQ81_008517 [Phrynocephalus forsythii]|uniref:Uncharacterized protein n=1 Tax=Phrynocephalus forsythii TaxID=171643 RepID=A0A9Q1ASE4_9SAUR|nr:hypothetical protein JRQ81_008517 [Phrynocephalus forsythii]